MDRDNLYKSGNVIYIRASDEIFLSFDRESGEFVVNLTTKDLVKATDWCGVRSGRDVDKWSEMHLTRGNAQTLIYAPIIEESPVNIECQVDES